ncbi:uncharacterized protein LOC122042647 [Zingiber officinale]|uniref:uncharacterized protein LOC122042647 n=1 Tax=Zingiber officinale TaxID=94328 RepID=UPI001C4C78C5|nr:uncharacterized protein LOC122042647 [Zingiber officinale]
MENEKQEDDSLVLRCLVDHAETISNELESNRSEVDKQKEKVVEVTVDTRCNIDNSKEELELLLRRVKTTATLFTYMKSKARIMAIPQLAHTSCGIKLQEGIGFVDKFGVPLSNWSKDVDICPFEDADKGVQLTNSPRFPGSIDVYDRAYNDEMLSSVHTITDVMEFLVKRVIIAETDAANQKELVKLGLEENRRKTLQIEIMSARVEEVENFAFGANNILSEMRQKVVDMVEETARQRQQAEENKQELHRVKQNFETLRSFAKSLISVREALLSAEQQFRSVEELFDSLSAGTSRLENEKVQKEAEVQKLIEENAGLRALVDKKEAQLLAMNEQCKFIALRSPGI